jgi:hypothetical protein
MVGGFGPTLLLCMTRGFLVGPLLSLWAHYLAVFKPQVIFLFYYFMFPQAGVVGGGLCGAWGGVGEVGGVPLHGVVILCLYIIKKIVCLCVCVCVFFCLQWLPMSPTFIPPLLLA